MEDQIAPLLNQCGRGPNGVDWRHLFDLDLEERGDQFYEELNKICPVSVAQHHPMLVREGAWVRPGIDAG
jgi:hypothetical protein